MNPFELVKPEQAAKELNTSADTIRSAMEQNTLPFPLGFYVSHDNRSAFFIYRGLLEQFKMKEGKITIRKQVNNMDRDNKREITISIPESIYEELQNAAKQLSGWEHEQLQGTEREISDSWEPEDVVTAAVITWLSERRE